MTGGNFEVGKDFLKMTADKVERAFLVDIFSILEDPNQNMTATEVLQRAQEKGYLLAPMIGRQQSELFGPMVTREIDILDRGQDNFRPRPNKVRKMGKLEWEVVYESRNPGHTQKKDQGARHRRDVAAVGSDRAG